MIAITTSSSMRVKAEDRPGDFCIASRLCRVERVFTIISLLYDCSPRIEHLRGNISSLSQTKLNLRTSPSLRGTITISRVSAVRESDDAQMKALRFEDGTE